MPRISVIIPCHNCIATLDETVESLLRQTEADWEAIFVDDGSTDETPARLAVLARTDARFRVLRQANAGPSAARNAGVAAANATFVAFLDADDLWLPRKLEEVLTALSGPRAPDAVFGRIGFFRDADRPDSTQSTVPRGSISLRHVLGENPVCTLSNLSVRRDSFLRLSGFDTRLRHSEDLEFMIRLVGSGRLVLGLDSLHVRYRASPQGLSARLDLMHDGWRQAVWLAVCAGTELSPAELRRAEAVHLRYLARRALRIAMPPRTALSLALRGVRLSFAGFVSDRRRGWATLLGCCFAPVLPAPVRHRLFCD